DHASEVRARLCHGRVVDVAPAQECVLNDVLRLGERAEHPVREPHQEVAVRLERVEWCRGGHGRLGLLALQALDDLEAITVGISRDGDAPPRLIDGLRILELYPARLEVMEDLAAVAGLDGYRGGYRARRRSGPSRRARPQHDHG